MLLLHATSFCGGVWAPVWAAAAGAGAPSAFALAPDARGHGASDAPGAPAAYAWTQLVDDVIAWIDALPSLLPDGAPADGIVLIGHSSGATTALAAAARRPGRVAGVLAVEPVLFDPPAPGADGDSYPGSRFMAAQALRRRARFESLAEARARLTRRPPYAGFAAATLDAFLAFGLAAEPGGGLVLRCLPATESACYDGAAALDLAPLLPRIVCPVRLVLGERSFTAPTRLQRFCQQLPGACVESIPAGSHFVALEQPVAVGAAIARFLREVTPIRVA